MKSLNNTLPKILEPGNRVVKINAISLKTAKYPEDGDPLDLILHMEGVDQGEDWEGFLIDNGDESKGRHKGQVGRVRATPFPFAYRTYNSGDLINRNDQILGFIRELSTQLHVAEKIAVIEAKTIEDFVNAASPILASSDQWLYVCLAGREYNNRNGYPTVNLNLPYAEKAKKPFKNAESEPSKVLEFREDMIRRKKDSKPVERFDAPVSGEYDIDF